MLEWDRIKQLISIAGWLWFSLPLLSFAGLSQADTVCAQVKIEIQQELTLERQAFDAMMRISNGLDTLPIENCRAPNYHRIFFQTRGRRKLKIYDRFARFSS
jgi:hypothetical protein